MANITQSDITFSEHKANYDSIIVVTAEYNGWRNAYRFLRAGMTPEQIEITKREAKRTLCHDINKKVEEVGINQIADEFEDDY